MHYTRLTEKLFRWCLFSSICLLWHKILNNFSTFQFALEFEVSKGDYFGFSWGNYGIVAFDWTDKDVADPEWNRNYCGEELKAKDVGNL